MAEFYYSTRDYNVITNLQLAEAHFLSTGQKLTTEEINNPEFMDNIALDFMGLIKRVDHPSYRLLAKNGHKVSAIKVYHNEHGVTLIEAKRRVEAFIGGGKSNGRKRHNSNAKSHNGSIQRRKVEAASVSNESKSSSSDIQVNEGLKEV